MNIPGIRFLRRQTDLRFSVSNSTTNACQLATTYTLAQGQLFADGSLVTGSSILNSAPLGPLAADGDIVNGFSVQNNQLVWTNAAFTNQVARFCISASNVLTAVFRGLAPSGCSSVTLDIVPSECLAQFVQGAENGWILSSVSTVNFYIFQLHDPATHLLFVRFTKLTLSDAR